MSDYFKKGRRYFSKSGTQTTVIPTIQDERQESGLKETKDTMEKAIRSYKKSEHKIVVKTYAIKRG